MSDPIQAFMQANGLASQRFPANSRYAGVGVTQLVRPDGSTVACLQRRFIAQPEQFPPWLNHVVISGDRLDSLAARYFGDPQLYWRLCDANRALRPQDLTDALGRQLLITLQADALGAGGA